MSSVVTPGGEGGDKAVVPPVVPMGTSDYFAGTDEQKALGLFQILGERGVTDETAAAEFDRELSMQLYRGMLTIRVTDARMMALQRQGRIGFYGEAKGQEASVIGTAAATDKDDWIIPALREAGVGLYRGLTPSSYIAQIYGNENDVTKGRQMPCHPCDRENNYVVMSSVVASQIPHTTGIALSMKMAGHKKVCVGYMGDGATSEADFHVALNFAAVMHVPAVFVCQNNQWAISTPGTSQTVSETIAIKGLGYGMESLRVDGNDVLAVYRAAKYAVDKARRGDGPTFLELLTYRVSAHTSSDDPSRYRDESVTEVWKAERCPLTRMRRFLASRGWLDDAADKQMADAIEAEVRRAVAEQEAAGSPPSESLIEDVYETPTWRQREQLAEYLGKGD